MTTPNPQDVENAPVRREIADRQAAEWREAEALAAEALGSGWRPWMKLVLIDGEYHRTGDNTPVAVAYRV